jgi:bifunctional DNase/RNase
MDENDFIQVEIYGMSLSSSLTGGGYAIILKSVDDDRRLPIIIGQFEAQAIAIQLEGIVSPRPLTHDLIKDIIEGFGYTVEYVVIDKIEDSTFYAKIKFAPDEIGEMDSRPSDAIAIALKFQAPIYVSRSVMDEVGFVPENLKPEQGYMEETEKIRTQNDINTNSPEYKKQRLEELRKELEDAISNEEYEKAASIRDEIKKLGISNIN